MTTPHRSLLLRTYLLLLLFLGLRAFGNLSLAFGTKRLPETLSANPLAYLRSMLDPYVAAGIAMLIVALLVRMALLSLADLSFVLPMTAVGYVLSALFGRVFLQEPVSPQRWLAVALIFGGSALVGSTPRSTTKQEDRSQEPEVRRNSALARSAAAKTSSVVFRNGEKPR
jgi:drug/metabolite transporter (DMT)-like permease